MANQAIIQDALLVIINPGYSSKYLLYLVVQFLHPMYVLGLQGFRSGSVHLWGFFDVLSVDLRS